MDTNVILISLAGVLATGAPLLFAVLGETITERAGLINLSMNGSILLSAMGGFAVAYSTGSLILGFLTGMAIGALMALIVAFGSIYLHQSQVAVGFVLALLGRDLSYFIGVPYMNIPGPALPSLSIPILRDIPFLGPLIFRQNVMTYLSFILVIIVWLWIYRTRPGLMLRGIGERPSAAFVRGANVNRLRYFYTILGGAIIGLAGPVYTLNVKPGWMGTQTGLDGIGWIALAITIFGAWNPIRAAFGVYLFALLQWLGIVLQPKLPGVPSQVLQVAPFPLMILALLLVNIGSAEWVQRSLAGLPEKSRRSISKVLRVLQANPPGGLGVPFDNE
jgi:simple sugar transport system permease protein